jgi:5-methylcytosine-specific restriction protein B
MNTILISQPGRNSQKICNEVWEQVEDVYWAKKSEKIMNKIQDECGRLNGLLTKNTPQLILQGPPGTGKTRKAKQIAIYSITGETPDNDEGIKEKVQDNNDQIKLIQFHPAYNYDDFVRGLVPKPDQNGNLTFKPENKVLLDMADKAKNNTNNSYFLIIDEINRANLPAVLGELIYALEYRDTEVDCLYPESSDDDGKVDRKISLPSNLYIIGTMNTADRSVGTLDYAVRRRFVFEHLPPNPNLLQERGFDDGYGLFQQVKGLFLKSEQHESSQPERNHLSPEFDYDDVMIGHSYFMANGLNEGEDLKNNLEYKIKPILREYAKDGVLIDNGGDVMTEIENLKVSENND